ASGIAREVHAGTLDCGASAATPAPAHPARRSAARTPRLTKFYIGRPLVLAAERVDEGHLQLAGVGRAEREREERVLAHRLRGVEGGDLLAEVRRHDAGDVVVLLLDDLALGVALDPLHRMDHERAHAHDVAG